MLLSREWLVTNGLGGYSSSTVAGAPTRSWHGLLVAALPAPLGRVLMMEAVSDQMRLADGNTVRLGGAEYAAGVRLEGVSHLVEFHLDAGIPTWTYEIHGVVLQKRLWMPHNTNTILLRYRLLEGAERLRVKLMPTIHFRPYDSAVSMPLPRPFHLQVTDSGVALHSSMSQPVLRMRVEGADSAFTVESRYYRELVFRSERARGYESSGELYSPGYFRADITTDKPVTFIGSAEPWEVIDALPPDQSEVAEVERRARLLVAAHSSVKSGFGAELVLAADQFLITPAARVEETARARATGGRGPLGHCRLPLVHRLGPRHDDQP